ncbi:MAG: hypothetical protein E7314_02485 [Clostridiales bacterium]|nr:hypothetical protein [Clostridiales bacterium]
MDFGKRLVEVEEILNYLVPEEKAKIPKEVFVFINKKKDKEYKWQIDKSKKLKDQDLPDDTFAILAYINMKFLLNEEQKELMEQFYELNDRKK